MFRMVYLRLSCINATGLMRIHPYSAPRQPVMDLGGEAPGEDYFAAPSFSSSAVIRCDAGASAIAPPDAAAPATVETVGLSPPTRRAATRPKGVKPALFRALTSAPWSTRN